ncbi:molybdenum cofactor cytidylyltransferase [Marinitoga hydrogenitolerans DSM 16785]|uniref:Molybdenum cofactor cytidylyltransferase n=1 Tax=Marinitoga hydrogenitolerans (strain DSM 16785 / JCM 12826 / AT1271) TaxID=1122195 RepID=A0A1M4YCL1_MARH1|nr:nucleotidyltransferase family protein [Marinitoga hydrogenitolerans]SHF03480.1 molybdenum cofactor cytidylyltransferase [Marinitoga hydrogenitolerans DSM 16785]
MKILGVILAAGLSSRFKGNKLLFKYNEKPLLQWTIDLLNNFEFDKLIIVNEKWKEFKDIFHYNNYKIIENPDYKSGISSSVKIAINYALDNSYDNVLIFLGDMPLIPKEIIEQIISKKTEKFIIAPYYNGKKGFPTLIKKDLFNDILKLKGDAGIKQIIKKHPEYVEIIDTNFPEITVDFDYKT